MSAPTRKYSITMPHDIAEQARERSGPSGFSSYIAAAVARQLEQDKLDELVAAFDAENGQVTEEQLEELEQRLDRARREQNTRGAGHAA